MKIKSIVLAFALAVSLPAVASTIEVGFSPDAGAEELVLKAIGSAKKAIRLAAYSFTSTPVISALIAAKHRGVDVACTLDKSNATNKSGQAAANLLSNSGIPVRIDSMHAIHHDKYIIVDEKSVETGSFNYSKAAAHSNAENAIVVWDDSKVAATYLDNWRLHWGHSEVWKSTY